MPNKPSSLDRTIDYYGDRLANAVIMPFSLAARAAGCVWDYIFEPQPTIISTQPDPDKRPSYARYFPKPQNPLIPDSRRFPPS